VFLFLNNTRKMIMWIAKEYYSRKRIQEIYQAMQELV